MADSVMLEAKKPGFIPGARMHRSLLKAYSQGGATVQALDLLGIIELKEASCVEDLGSSKTISFYDLGLLYDYFY